MSVTHTAALLAGLNNDDGISLIRHIDAEGRDWGAAWAVTWQGKRLDMLFGSRTEAADILAKMKGWRGPYHDAPITEAALARREAILRG
jgi:hypothetical protein